MVSLEFELWEISVGLHIFVIVSLLLWRFKWYILKKITQDEYREKVFYHTHK
ncbi:9 protein [Cytorhabdovirus hordei]|uniref:9 protein n=1 Tax=Cytorhabdovirus hordei TaxID=1985699 RepID=A0A0C5KP04_9RHAB|nr:9 protein [Cytorhabdovirus hordei]AJP67523.1 9 protein [Cytorhabdovirus hordei]AYN07443.1 9 protein [Cytorhabdovirus hordei]